MDDVITAIRELCEAKCVELLPSINTTENDFVSELLNAYESHPKVPTGRVVDKTVWKVSAATGLTEVFRLSPRDSYTTHSSTVHVDSIIETVEDDGESDPSVIAFSALFLGIICDDLMLLYQALGTMSDPEGSIKESKIKG
jgi:hypothetical protein